MKKIPQILLAMFAFVAVFGFTNTDKFPKDVSEDTLAMYETQYIKTIPHGDLTNCLETNFSDLFDTVTSVDVQLSEETGYYYLVFGEKDNEPVIELIATDKEDIDNERCPTIDLSNLDISGAVEYCYTPVTPSIGCPVNCEYNGSGFCPTKRCGVWNGSTCIPF